MASTTLKPTRKQGTTGVTGAAVVVIIYIAGLFGVEVPPEVAASSVLLIGWLAGYFTPERKTHDIPR